MKYITIKSKNYLINSSIHKSHQQTQTTSISYYQILSVHFFLTKEKNSLYFVENPKQARWSEMTNKQSLGRRYI